MHRQVTIARQKLWANGMTFEWKWVYSVTPANGKTVSIGTVLAEAVSWAKRHSQNANEIVRAWDGKRVPMPR